MTFPDAALERDSPMSRHAPASHAPSPLRSWIAPAQRRNAPLTTSDALVDALLALGVTQAFGVLGGGIGPFAAALARSPIRLLHCRSEAGASFAAIEASLASGRMTVVLATTGPGVTSLVTGMAAARSEGAHVLFVSGATSAAQRGRTAFQETTTHGGGLAGLFQPGQLLDHAQVLEDAAELPSFCVRLARGLDRPAGFVAHVGFPLDVQTAESPWIDLRVRAQSGAEPSRGTIEHCRGLLRPGRFVIWAGFGARHAADQVTELAERAGVPVICSPRAKGVIPEDHPLFLGVTGLGGHTSVREYFERHPVERVLVLGSRLGEMTSFWARHLVPPGGFVHVDIDDSAFGAAYPDAETCGVQSDVRSFLAGLIEAYAPSGAPSPELIAKKLSPRGAPIPGLVRYSALMAAVQRQVVAKSDAIVLTEAGNSFILGSHYLEFGQARRYRVSTRFGSMGQAAAGVLGAASAHGRAVALVGDGALLMFNELSTAAKYRISAVWVVLNDARYGMVEDGMRAVGWEPFETDFPRTDFAQVARAMGVEALRVVDEHALDAALEEAVKHDGPFLLDVWITPSEPAPKNPRNDSLVIQGINAEPSK